MATITSATAVLILTIPGVYPNGIQIQQFGVDNAFDVEEAETAVVQVGVDGIGVGGWVPRNYVMPITILASSPSRTVFSNWLAAEDANNEVIYASGILRMIAVTTSWTMAQGALTRFSRIPNARRVLEPRRYTITWMPPDPLTKAISSSPIAA